MAVTINGNEYLEGVSRFLPGFYTVDTLPPANQSQGSIAFVTDLGNGAGNCVSDGTYWIPPLRRQLITVAPQGTIQVDALKKPSIYLISDTINMNMSFQVDGTNLYPGYTITIRRANPLSAVLGLVGSLGIRVNNGGSLGPNLALTEQSTTLVWDGTKFLQF